MEISNERLDEILADFSSPGHTAYLDDPMLGFGYAATDLDAQGIPEFTPDLSPIPVALFERHQALWTQPDDDTPPQEVWTEQAVLGGMERIGYGVHRLPNLEGWAIGAWPHEGVGLQLQQPDGNLFVYALCTVGPAWITAVERYQRVLVLHGPRLGLRTPAGRRWLRLRRVAIRRPWSMSC